MAKSRPTKTEIKEKRQMAFELFCAGWPQNQIAESIGVAEQTLSGWKKEDNWEETYRAELARDKQTHIDLKAIYSHQVSLIRQWQEENPDKMIDKGMPDALNKLYQMIKPRVTEFTDLVNIIKELSEFIGEKDPELAKGIVDYCTSFIVQKRKQLS